MVVFFFLLLPERKGYKKKMRISPDHDSDDHISALSSADAAFASWLGGKRNERVCIEHWRARYNDVKCREEHRNAYSADRGACYSNALSILPVACSD